MKETKVRDPLLVEAIKVNYKLRSTFFYRKLREYNTLNLPLLVADLLPMEHLYQWDERKEWGIGQEAFSYIVSSDLKLVEVFCHPKLIREHPTLLAYYRNVAVLSQKAVSYLTGRNISKYEFDSENKNILPEKAALSFAKVFNEHTTLIIDSSLQTFDAKELYGLLLALTGAQIDGSWRNAIGEEAERVVQQLLIKATIERNLLSAFIYRLGTKVEPFEEAKKEEQLTNLKKYRGIMLSNQTSILFSSEPDISLINGGGRTVAIIEVKGGADPAGALERYGAAKKSFEQVLRDNSSVTTILIASSITSEVQSRILQDATVSEYYNLTEILNEQAVYQRFVERVFGLLS